MSAFEKVIGYSSEKKELLRIADILRNPGKYAKLGVSVPRGLLLHGVPGVGKTLMATALMEESGRTVYTVRKNQPDGDFVRMIRKAFEDAAENAPSIVFLDDMDKFANEDERHPDTEEYVTVQSCIDEMKGKDVFVLATANSIRALPRSLCRAGRFDRVIKITAPRGEDAKKIIEYYLSKKAYVKDIDMDSLARILDGSSCAQLETILNEAGMIAGYKHEEAITMEHIMEVCLPIVYDVPPCEEVTEEETYNLEDGNHLINQIVYHEAGHAVVSELLCPDSVNFVYVFEGDHEGGLTDYYNDGSKMPLYWAKSRILSALAGAAAVEQKYGVADMGCRDDLDTAFNCVWNLIAGKSIQGFQLHGCKDTDSEHLSFEQEQAVSNEVERYYRQAKEILSLNKDFYESVAVNLAKKKLLTAKDIQSIKQSCTIVPAYI